MHRLYMHWPPSYTNVTYTLYGDMYIEISISIHNSTQSWSQQVYLLQVLHLLSP